MPYMQDRYCFPVHLEEKDKLLNPARLPNKFPRPATEATRGHYGPFGITLSTRGRESIDLQDYLDFLLVQAVLPDRFTFINGSLNTFRFSRSPPKCLRCNIK